MKQLNNIHIKPSITKAVKNAHRSRKKHVSKGWDPDLKIPEGLTFAELGDLAKS